MAEEKSNHKIESSFRDPSGFLFYRKNNLYRQINKKYQKDYDFLNKSGLAKKLIKENLLIPHKEVQVVPGDKKKFYKIIQPDLIPFICYPYEWSFSQFKDAALTTLAIQKIALEHEMSLKDASMYNIQFYNGRPIFIDTLSFEKYKKNKPWIAYKQFCQHFLAPLALMAYRDIRLNQLLRIYIDGIPLDLASKLLPVKTNFSFSLFSHIHLHARTQEYYADKEVKTSERKITKQALRGLVDNLEGTIKKLKWQPKGTEWGEYYTFTNYSSKAFKNKEKIINRFLAKSKSKIVWDLGANTGLFSRIAGNKKIFTVSSDVDPAAVEKNYCEVKRKNEKYILPMVLDLTNPSSGIGWDNSERDSMTDRGPTDMIFALALIHHLAISNNLPFDKISEFFAKIGKWLIIEFVPKEDSQVKKLLTTREDIFDKYDQENFEKEFKKYFKIEDSILIRGSKRTMYLMRVK